MKANLTTTVEEARNRTLAARLFGEALAKNLDTTIACPLKAALRYAMGTVTLPFEDWVKIIQWMLPELSDEDKLWEYIFHEDFTYITSFEGEHQLFAFEQELTRRKAARDRG